jgi:hypothetical protein
MVSSSVWLIMFVEVCAGEAQFRSPSYDPQMLDRRLLLVFLAAATLLAVKG